MRLRPKQPVRVAVGLLLLGLAALGFGAGAALSAAATGMITPIQYQGEERGASLLIAIQSEEGAEYPPGDLVLSDPSARMTGSDTRANSSYQEIPGATYSSETISTQQQAFRLYVGNAVSGTYSLRVIGVDSGRYILSMKGYDQAGNHADLRFTASLQPGEVQHYVIHYSNQGGASLRARRTSAAE
jgi:hypothetical protein